MGNKNSNYKYSMGGRVLDVIDSEKDVGVTIHKSLKPSLQCARAATKANLVLGQLARAVTYRDRTTFIRLYQMYVWPHLEYAAQSWCPWNVADKEILEKVQRRAINMVSNLRGRTYEEKLSELGMVNLEARRRRRNMIQIFKILSGIDHVQPATWFILENTLVREGAAQTRSTTSNHTIMEMWANTDIRRNFFSQRMIKPWNNLPDQIKSVSSVDIFKNDYDIWLSYQ